MSILSNVDYIKSTFDKITGQFNGSCSDDRGYTALQDVFVLVKSESWSKLRAILTFDQIILVKIE